LTPPINQALFKSFISFSAFSQWRVRSCFTPRV